MQFRYFTLKEPDVSGIVLKGSVNVSGNPPPMPWCQCRVATFQMPIPNPPHITGFKEEQLSSNHRHCIKVCPADFGLEMTKRDFFLKLKNRIMSDQIFLIMNHSSSIFMLQSTFSESTKTFLAFFVFLQKPPQSKYCICSSLYETKLLLTIFSSVQIPLLSPITSMWGSSAFYLCSFHNSAHLSSSWTLLLLFPGGRDAERSTSDRQIPPCPPMCRSVIGCTCLY